MKTLLVALLIGFLAPPAGGVEPPLGSETSPATPVEAIEVRQVVD